MDKCLHIISRDKAIELGMSTYFTGIECKNGHTEERSVKAHRCMQCARETSRSNSVKPRVREMREKRVKSGRYKEVQSEYLKRYHAENRERRIRRMREYYAENREYLLNKSSEYAKREDVKERKSKAFERWSRTPEGAASKAMRSMATRLIRAAKLKKYKSSIDYLSYDVEDFVRHIESLFKPGMTWENHGEWHVDHICPVSWFVKNGITDPDVVNALDNLQPLWAHENKSKHAKYGDKYVR